MPMRANTLTQRLPMVPATTYTVVPSASELVRHNLQGQDLEVLFLVTQEMLESALALMDALNAQGFETDAIYLDIDGKRKLVRNNWELITVGTRRLHLVPSTTQYAQTFVPFGLLVAPTETYEVMLWALLALREAIYRFSGRWVMFRGQNSDAHKSTLKLGRKLEEMLCHTLCFPHVLRVPMDTAQRHYLRGTQEEKDAFLQDVVKPDVSDLALCQTTKQEHVYTFLSILKYT